MANILLMFLCWYYFEYERQIKCLFIIHFFIFWIFSKQDFPTNLIPFFSKLANLEQITLIIWLFKNCFLQLCKCLLLPK